MMTIECLDRITRVRWFNPPRLSALTLAMLCAALPTPAAPRHRNARHAVPKPAYVGHGLQKIAPVKPAAVPRAATESPALLSLAEIAKSYRASPTPAGREQLLAQVRSHPYEQSAALARFTLGVSAFTEKNYSDAIEQLNFAREDLVRLNDYIAHYLGLSYAALGDWSNAAREQGIVRTFAVPSSPLAPKARVLESQALLQSGSDKVAAKVLGDRDKVLPQPEGYLTLAQAYEAAGDWKQAAVSYQKVYFGYPATTAAAQAAESLNRLRIRLGSDYPRPTTADMLDRGDKWIAGKYYDKARAEYHALAAELTGPDREIARLREALVDYHQGDYAGALGQLKSLDLPHSEADAERDYYVAECARKTGDDNAMMDAVKQLGRHHAQSAWRLKALVSGGNRYLLERQPDKYEPLYRAAYENFPPDTTTAYCHWKIAWNAYLGHRKDAAYLLREQVEKYPFDGKAAAALYFLGRLSEVKNDNSAARAFYTKLDSEFPHYYYGVLARDRLTQAKVVAASASSSRVENAEWLTQVKFPEIANYAETQPSEATQARIERARLLTAAGFSDWAETELRFGAKIDGQPHLLAIELAKSAVAPHRSLRLMKSMAPDYLSMPFNSAPRHFWEILFPLPYKEDLIQSARAQNLDPFHVAALIRQESEFNPSVVSHANAYGLTQLVPGTGRLMAQRQGVRDFQTAMLFEPSTNLRLGTGYLRTQLDQWGGRWEETLAAYNAGPGRVREWLASSSYSEPAEFVESIPFTETREYVQAVIRNADVYRLLYAGSADLLVAHGDLPDEPVPARKAAARRVPVLKHAAVPHGKRRRALHSA